MRESLHLDLSFLPDSVKSILYTVESLYEYSYIHMELLNKVVINMNILMCVAFLLPRVQCSLEFKNS